MHVQSFKWLRVSLLHPLNGFDLWVRLYGLACFQSSNKLCSLDWLIEYTNQVSIMIQMNLGLNNTSCFHNIVALSEQDVVITYDSRIYIGYTYITLTWYKWLFRILNPKLLTILLFILSYHLLLLFQILFLPTLSLHARRLHLFILSSRPYPLKWVIN